MILVNGEAIYDSSAWEKADLPENNKLSFTKKDGALYVILKDWKEEPISISNIKKAGNVKLLGYEGKIDSKLQGGKLIFTPPHLSINEYPSQHAWVFKIDKFED